MAANTTSINIVSKSQPQPTSNRKCGQSRDCQNASARKHERSQDRAHLDRERERSYDRSRALMRLFFD